MSRELRVAICFSLLRSCLSSSICALAVSARRVFQARRHLFSVHVARCSLDLESINLLFISTVIRCVSTSRPGPLLPRKENSRFHPRRDFIGPPAVLDLMLNNITSPVENRTEDAMVMWNASAPVKNRTTGVMVKRNLPAHFEIRPAVLGCDGAWMFNADRGRR